MWKKIGFIQPHVFIYTKLYTLLPSLSNFCTYMYLSPSLYIYIHVYRWSKMSINNLFTMFLHFCIVAFYKPLSQGSGFMAPLNLSLHTLVSVVEAFFNLRKVNLHNSNFHIDLQERLSSLIHWWNGLRIWFVYFIFFKGDILGLQVSTTLPIYNTYLFLKLRQLLLDLFRNNYGVLS